jgi:hypothetical protein
MICGQKLHVGRELSLLADRKLRRVQEYRAKIYKQFGAERDLRTVITIKGGSIAAPWPASPSSSRNNVVLSAMSAGSLAL